MIVAVTSDDFAADAAQLRQGLEALQESGAGAKDRVRLGLQLLAQTGRPIGQQVEAQLCLSDKGVSQGGKIFRRDGLGGKFLFRFSRESARWNSAVRVPSCSDRRQIVASNSPGGRRRRLFGQRRSAAVSFARCPPREREKI